MPDKCPECGGKMEHLVSSANRYSEYYKCGRCGNVEERPDALLSGNLEDAL